MKPWQHLSITAPTRLMGLCLFIGFSLLTASLANIGTAHAHGSTTIPITNCQTDRQLQAAVSTAPSGATIPFHCSGDILLSKTLTITKNLTLDGAGQAVTLDGHGSVQAIVVNSSVNFTLNNLTIARGSSSTVGGGLFNSGGTVTISGGTFTSNTAFAGGGIFNGGTMTISNGTITNNMATGNGGGIINVTAGTVTISGGTISANTAFAGGGTFNSGTMAFSNSTIANNTATTVGGGFTNATTGTVTISGGTISANTAFAGGGIFNVGMATIDGSLIANNTATVAGGGIINATAGTTAISGSTTTLALTLLEEEQIVAFLKTLTDGFVPISNSNMPNNLTTVAGGGITTGNGGTLTISNSVLRNNVPTNCAGSLTKGKGNNSSGTSCSF
jgi:fibronectin-binding autotransporter adhesin